FGWCICLPVVSNKSSLLKTDLVFLNVLAQAKRRFLETAGRPAADPTADEDANIRRSHGFPAVWLLPPIVPSRGPCRRSTRELLPGIVLTPNPRWRSR